MSAQERAKTAAAEEKTTTEASGLLDTILSKGMRARDDDAQQRGRDLLGDFVEQLLDPSMVVAKDTEKTINLRSPRSIGCSRRSSTRSCTTPTSRSWKARWRGPALPRRPERDRARPQDPRPERHEEGSARRTWSGPPSSTRARCSRRSTRKSTAPSAARRSACWSGDYEFGRHPQDIALLKMISNVAAAAHAPFVAGRQPELFELGQLHRAVATRATWPRSSSTVEYATWKSFRESEDSRYVGLTLPRVLARLPYGRKPSRSRRSTSRRTSTARTTTSTCG